MGITKRWIGELQENAESGDREAQDALRGVGLWETEAEKHEREAEHRYSTDEASSNDPVRFFEITEAS